VQNVVAPVRFGEEAVEVTPTYVEQIREAVASLSDRHNVLVKFIGYTDDAPLSERNARIYGDQVGLSRAQARRVALAVQEELGLATSAVDSDGRGSSRPLGSNATAQGRALNRRVEVEFWYDDPLQDRPDEPQLCPVPGNEMVTRVYDPPWGELPELKIENGSLQVPAGLTGLLRRGLADVEGRTNARLRFVGYAQRQPVARPRCLRRRRGLVGVAAPRRRHRGRDELGRNRGSKDAAVLRDVVNAGFIRRDVPSWCKSSDSSRSSTTTRACGSAADMTQAERVRPEPDAHHRRRSAARRQGPQLLRHPALHRRRAARRRHPVRLRQPRGGPAARGRGGSGDGGVLSRQRRLGSGARALPHVCELLALHRPGRSADLRAGAVARGQPLALVVGPDGSGEWLPEPETFATPARELKYVLRAYGAGGSFDETVPQPLWIAYREVGPVAERSPEEQDDESSQDLDALLAEIATAGAPYVELPIAGTAIAEPATPEISTADPTTADRALREAYGENNVGLRNIQIHSGSVTVRGNAIPPGHMVYVAGRAVPVADDGSFVAEEILPSGVHTVEVAVLDAQGNGELYLRDIELQQKDWFYVGMADVTPTSND
jgi:hypothetical protein